MAVDSKLFEQGIERENTGCVKWDMRSEVFGRADVVPLWIADMDFAAPECVTDAIVRRASHGAFGYCCADPAEKQALADWMKKRHNTDITPDDILFSPGVVDSLVISLGALGKAGDKVAVLTPVYGPFYKSILKNNMEIVRCRLKNDNQRWTIDFDALEDAFRQGVKWMLLCNPHNPVGRVWTRSELETLVSLTRRYGVTIISDEIHADLEMPGHKVTSIAALEPKSVVLVSATKTFNLAAVRMSSVIIRDADMRQKYADEYAARGVDGVNVFGRIAQRAAYEGGEEWLDALLSYLAGTRDMVEAFLKAELPKVTCAPLEGTYLMWLDFSYLGMEQEALRRMLIDEAGVGMGSGTDFGEEGTGFMRLNIATPRENVMRALRQIADCLNKR